MSWLSTLCRTPLAALLGRQSREVDQPSSKPATIVAPQDSPPGGQFSDKGRGIHPYWLVVGIAALSLMAVSGFQHIVQERDEARFRNATEAVQDSIRVRLDAYLSILQSTRSLFLSQAGNVDLATFRAFVSGLDLERRYPGIQGLGFTRRMHAGEVDAVIATAQRQGQEPFRLWPAHARDEYHAIIFLEPLDRRNRAALGYDMFTEAVRQDAMSRARDSGMAAASGRVTLVQEIDPQKQAGFLIYVPVYRGGALPQDVQRRRDFLLGFVYSAFRVDDLMRGIFGTQQEPRVAFDLYDGVELTEAHLLHRGISPQRQRGHRSAVVRFEIAGRPWTLHVLSTASFESASSGRFLPHLIAVALAVNLGFFFVIRAQLRAQRDEAAAHRRFATLAETSKRFSEAQLDLAAVLRTVCLEVTHRLRDCCTLNLLDAEGTRLELAETAHLDPDVEEEIRTLLSRKPIPIGETKVGQVAATGEPVLIPVVNFQELLSSTPSDYRLHLEKHPIASLLVVPLRQGERIIGTLTCSRSPGLPPYTVRDRELLQEIADRAAVALENARLAERLQQAVRLRDEFLSIAGHELRTPLTALQLQVEGLLHQAKRDTTGAVPKRLIERLKKAQTHVSRLSVLIAGLLDVSRITAGKLELRREEVDLRGLLSEVIESFSEHSRRAGSPISMTAAENVVGQWDRARLDQVFTNLVSNALKYGAGKPVEIELACVDGKARALVRDHGIGISAGDLQRIFGRFERAVSERNYGGLGLGLWISHQIVEASGGHIHVESEVGVGSTFTVELPLRPRDHGSV